MGIAMPSESLRVCGSFRMWFNCIRDNVQKSICLKMREGAFYWFLTSVVKEKVKNTKQPQTHRHTKTSGDVTNKLFPLTYSVHGERKEERFAEIQPDFLSCSEVQESQSRYCSFSRNSCKMLQIYDIKTSEEEEKQNYITT